MQVYLAGSASEIDRLGHGAVNVAAEITDRGRRKR